MTYLVGGFSPYPSEKYNFVRWDDDNIWKNKSHVPNHQPVGNHKQIKCCVSNNKKTEVRYQTNMRIDPTEMQDLKNDLEEA